MDVVSAVQVAVAFTWLGMVLGISFLETPLKFRAPGITVQLGVGIGRLVFRALNAVEAVLAVTLAAAVALALPAVPWWRVAATVAVVLVVAVGAGVLRPRMDARLRIGGATGGRARRGLHIGYVVLEVLKVLLLVTVGVGALAG